MSGDWARVLTIVGIAGSGLVAGAFSIAYHVPRNNALAAVDPNAPGAADQWARYAREWTAGNHVRTVAGLGSTVALALSISLSA